MGFYGFEWFDTLTEQGKYILTRQKALIAISSIAKSSRKYATPKIATIYVTVYINVLGNILICIP
jgi:amino acid transporter